MIAVDCYVTRTRFRLLFFYLFVIHLCLPSLSCLSLSLWILLSISQPPSSWRGPSSPPAPHPEDFSINDSHDSGETRVPPLHHCPVFCNQVHQHGTWSRVGRMPDFTSSTECWQTRWKYFESNPFWMTKWPTTSGKLFGSGTIIHCLSPPPPPTHHMRRKRGERHRMTTNTVNINKGEGTHFKYRTHNLDQSRQMRHRPSAPRCTVHQNRRSVLRKTI